MTFAQYVVGLVLVGIVLVALTFGTRGARLRWLPTWRGAPAVLAELASGIAVVILVPQLLGVVGLFHRWPIVLALVAIGIGVGVLARRGAPHVASEVASTRAGRRAEPPVTLPARPRRELPYARAALIGSFAITAIAVAEWAGHVARSFRDGIHDGDSLWYHLPFAAHFVQSGYTTHTLFVSPRSLIPYFPANSETVSGVTMAVFGNDGLIPLLSLAWLALALLAGWCIGARYGAPAVGLAAVAMVMSVPLMAATQGGTARNDVVAVALALTTVALVVHSSWDPVAIGLAGAVNGLLLGVKLSSLPFAVLLLVGVLLVAPRRRAVVLPWIGGFVVFGAFWYLRNLVLVGNPLPFLGLGLGPLRLPKLHGEVTHDTAVLQRLRESGAYSRVLEPGLDFIFGPRWWVFVIVLAALLVATVVVGRGRTARMLGVVGLLTLIAYIVMPNGSPSAQSSLAHLIFGLNIRYAYIGIVLGYVLTVVLPTMDDGRIAAAAVAALAGLDVVVLARRHTFETEPEWLVSGSQRVFAIAAVVVVVVVIVAVVGARRLGARARPWTIGIAVCVVSVVVAGCFYAVLRDHFDERYRHARPGTTEAAWIFAQDVPESRIGVFGDILQYPYVGPHLANRVRSVGIETNGHVLRTPRTCSEWRRALADGHYDYVVTALDFVESNRDEIDRLRSWTASIPGTRVVVDGDSATVYRLTEVPDPDACP